MGAMNARTLLAFIAVVMATGAVAADRYPYQRCFEIASDLHGVPVDLLLGVAATESHWDPDARSQANAHGIMQIQWPGTARHLGVRRPAELYNPCLNIDLGARYLRELLDRFPGDEQRALAAYNYGPTRIEASVDLPAGALRYARTVAEHRQRVVATNGSWVAPDSDYEIIRFASHTRASRFAQVLQEKIDNARFSVRQRDGGSYGVTMSVSGTGLSVRDTMTLETLFGEEPQT